MRQEDHFNSVILTQEQNFKSFMKIIIDNSNLRVDSHLREVQ